MRGERLILGTNLENYYGSSPHARGTLSHSTGISTADRFIPACAGNAQNIRQLDDVYNGSSPHARGTRPRSAWRLPAGRFIPACAGNAGQIRRRILPQPVHPRMRGERAESPKSVLPRSGSSPHARGTLSILVCLVCAGRFIPACAGNAATDKRGKSRKPVHPRMRGERHKFLGIVLPVAGSSPHARGTLIAGPVEHLGPRFIPACAGNAAQSQSVAHQRTVHPRMRGERSAGGDANVSSYGSSPHARGTPRAFFPAADGVRFIPACAGNATLWKDS